MTGRHEMAANGQAGGRRLEQGHRHRRGADTIGNRCIAHQLAVALQHSVKGSIRCDITDFRGLYRHHGCQPDVVVLEKCLKLPGELPEIGQAPVVGTGGECSRVTASGNQRRRQYTGALCDLADEGLHHGQ
mgnify:CR=1 FL=1